MPLSQGLGTNTVEASSADVRHCCKIGNKSPNPCIIGTIKTVLSRCLLKGSYVYSHFQQTIQLSKRIIVQGCSFASFLLPLCAYELPVQAILKVSSTHPDSSGRLLHTKWLGDLRNFRFRRLRLQALIHIKVMRVKSNTFCDPTLSFERSYKIT